MKSITQQLFDIECEIKNLTMFVTQCMETLRIRIIEYQRLQKELYVEDGIKKANNFANTQKG